MCGIAGYIHYKGQDSRPTRRAVCRLAHDINKRGGHAWGVAWRIDGKLYHYKQPGAIVHGLRALWACVRDADAFIIHTRWATHGDVDNNDNNHPHPVGQRGFMVHNGVIPGHEYHAKNFGVKLKSECDSELISGLFFRKLKEHGTYDKAITQTLEDLPRSGSLACAFLMPDALILAKRGNPIVYGPRFGGYMFCSTSEGLGSGEFNLQPADTAQIYVDKERTWHEVKLTSGWSQVNWDDDYEGYGPYSCRGFNSKSTTGSIRSQADTGSLWYPPRESDLDESDGLAGALRTKDAQDVARVAAELSKNEGREDKVLATICRNRANRMQGSVRAQNLLDKETFNPYSHPYRVNFVDRDSSDMCHRTFHDYSTAAAYYNMCRTWWRVRPHTLHLHLFDQEKGEWNTLEHDSQKDLPMLPLGVDENETAIFEPQEEQQEVEPFTPNEIQYSNL